MGRDDAPAVLEAHPRLTLPPDPGVALAPELGHRRGEVPAMGRDHCLVQAPGEPGRRSRRAESANGVDADQVLRRAVAHRAARRPEELVEHLDAIVDERVLVARESRLPFGEAFGKIDLGLDGAAAAATAATGATATPPRSSPAATRSRRSSRHGAPMTWTPTGRPCGGASAPAGATPPRNS